MARPIDLDQLMKYPLRRGSEHCDEKNADPRFLNGVESILEWAQTLPTLTQPNEWVSVEERLPEYNPGTGAKSYWVAKKDSAGNWQMKIAQYCDYGYAMTVDAETEITWRDWDFTKIVSVTHWMPLPAPPDKDNNVLAKTPNEPLTCEGCAELGKWENEYEYGYPSPCTCCKRRACDNYRRPPEGEEDNNDGMP